LSIICTTWSSSLGCANHKGGPFHELAKHTTFMADGFHVVEYVMPSMEGREKVEHAFGIKVFEPVPAERVELFLKNGFLDGRFGDAGLLFLELLHLVEPSDEKQVGELFNYC
jgi:hypothetical protein